MSYAEEYDKKVRNCPQCKKDISKCSDCFDYICFDCKICSNCSQKKSYWGSEYIENTMCKPHQMCLECGEKIVCHLKGICAPCDKPFHKINNTVTVGSCGAPYDDYDLIFNLNYPENGAEKHKISYVYGKRPNEWGDKSVKKNFYNIGMYDRSTPEDLKIFRDCIQILKEIVEIQKKNGKDLNILFHCFAGYSRSVALATAYIAIKERISVDEAFELVKSKRKYVGPNADFMKIIREEL